MLINNRYVIMLKVNILMETLKLQKLKYLNEYVKYILEYYDFLINGVID